MLDLALHFFLHILQSLLLLEELIKLEFHFLQLIIQK